MRVTFSDAQRNVSEIANRETYNKDVIFELLAAYGRSASAITKLRSGSLNLAEDKDNEVLQRGVVYFKHILGGNLHSVIDSLDQDPLVVRYNPRYLIATDYDQLVAKDTKKDTTLDIKLRDIDRNVDFFYGWTGDEVTSEKTEAVADRRAADKMKDLYAEIELVNREKLANPKSTFRHDLNVFFSRLLFCFFAEDTKVFSKTDANIFTGSIKDYTQTDGSDLDDFLRTLFGSLDTEDKSGFTSPYSKFPYVNGTIFDTKKHNIAIPKFNAQARKLILDCGNQNWAEINPDIFGSMFQSIVDEEHRANNGMHYTSVPNIMKTIEPLFIDELREEFDKYYDDPKKLNKLWDRISKIKVFDPACGSGNFLIIAYKELRKIEHGIIDRLFSDDYKRAMLSGKLESKIKLDNFYGIEIDDFAHEIAILSLYLAKHQMNIEFEQHFGKEIILIPLSDNAKIVHGNATRLDWQDVCPNIQHATEYGKLDQQFLLEVEQEHAQEVLIGEEDLKQKNWDEIYLISNPPYLGSRNQKDQHRADMVTVFESIDGKYKALDYVAIWFYKGANYIRNTSAKLAFVATNSICQGEQVSMLWPNILDGIEIGYAYRSFKWTNSATRQAGITVVVISLNNPSTTTKKLFVDNIAREANHINAYLVDGDDIYFYRKTHPISQLPEMIYGNEPRENGNLLIEAVEYDKLIHQEPEIIPYIKIATGSQEYINSVRRYCLWLSDAPANVLRNKFVAERLEKVARYRLTSDRKDTQKMASKPHLFTSVTYKNSDAVLVPIVSSERREYIPIGYVDKSHIVLNSAQVINNAEPWVFSVIASKMHTVWVKALAGRMRTDIRYSSAILYNNFPLKYLTTDDKDLLGGLAREILFVREYHTEKTLAEMYDPNKMPEDLRQAHHELDLAVDKLYRSRPYNNDEERLADLFSLYEQMIAVEKEKK